MAKSNVKRASGSSVTRLPKVIHRALRAAFDKKAEGVTVLDLRKAALRRARIRPLNVEGAGQGEWVLLDYFDFLVHVFTPDTREFYALERLWGSAERIDVSEADLPAA